MYRVWDGMERAGILFPFLGDAEMTCPFLTACDRLYYCVELEDISILAVIFLLLFTVYFYDSNTRQKLMFNVHVRDRLPETVHS